MYIWSRVTLSYLTTLYKLLALHGVEEDDDSVQLVVRYNRFFVQANVASM